jgi:hypothetical protein
MTAITDRLAAALADRYVIERALGGGGMATERARGGERATTFGAGLSSAHA